MGKENIRDLGKYSTASTPHDVKDDTSDDGSMDSVTNDITLVAGISRFIKESDKDGTITMALIERLLPKDVSHQLPKKGHCDEDISENAHEVRLSTLLNNLESDVEIEILSDTNDETET